MTPIARSASNEDRPVVAAPAQAKRALPPLYDKIIGLPRRTKWALVLALDLSLVAVALVLAVVLRFDTADAADAIRAHTGVLVATCGLAAAVLHGLGIPQIRLHHTEARALASLALGATLLATIAAAAAQMLQAPAPLSLPLIFGTAFFTLAVGARLAILGTLFSIRRLSAGQTPVILYGAGTEGVQIAYALRSSGSLCPVAFVDDNRAFEGLRIAGLKVHGARMLPRLAARFGVKTVILALSSASDERRNWIAAEIRALGCEVQTLPSFAELIERGSVEQALRPVRPDDLLCRDKVDLDVPAVTRTYAGRTVMVTGAGGSIGSELCRQLVDCRPARIVLFEHSEFALYEIDAELRTMLVDGTGIEVRARLGSVTNESRVRQVIESEGVDFILHAAAYKHVPMVEDNELEGACNNVIGTRIVARAAVDAGVERFMLVSTDKAVRPTNVMGASKRLAEMVVQDLQRRNPRTTLAMVRFGNVLGSSGSVLPLFQKQIARGGPITVTHPEVTRYFMTIPEAARLVLLGGAFAAGGDVFVLDMGEPVRIMELARRMIELSGAKVQSDTDPDGIAIRVTGLRPGEKLYEELVIGDALTATPHEKILRAEEEHLSEIETQAMLRAVQAAIDAGDAIRLRTCIERYVSGYHIPATADAM
ncbi:NDP-sugar epimerase, includes UDP-GlcNAc-inverting 4,6-dehydratase FlaA1 and capsular polysaccharide biosynthesis protein EpsC [Palleronia marisminoris]|uniref:UDP-N-acetyl-alpha-D-glucosamine C6 dehydratase n=1 Tax=Palleronia marisminoris TaxID=315423 RepID=A0A1Y5SY19_9RHOB|nr:nucleoside-diphosphate sugar epimerase/dehydratase [Palleronia marisminoris]SFH05751.1 NDP-sugar epimerase, includes UDP-GlcNAc-inverting 4,6-dehydratase FlaA1 and capsular polysaccharide biosynthesis protein EpsC [Palleronia marisminoris]SLN50870.1 UDP-N-acetyl-alpha-D-glucosamine C6 dehydratase [Palleronia marisminoris]